MDKSIPTPARILLNFIYETDAGKPAPACYQIIYGNRQKYLTTPITRMTLNEVIAANKNWSSTSWIRSNWHLKTSKASSATGAAQFMHATLVDLKHTMKLTGFEIFDADLQDRMAFQLLVRRGYFDFVNKRISRTKFGLNLAKEWASFPVLETTRGSRTTVYRGASYYSGDGLNKERVSAETIERVLDKVLAAAVNPPKPTEPVVPIVDDFPVATGAHPAVIPGVFAAVIGGSAAVYLWLSSLPCNVLGIFCGGN